MRKKLFTVISRSSLFLFFYVHVLVLFYAPSFVTIIVLYWANMTAFNDVANFRKVSFGRLLQEEFCLMTFDLFSFPGHTRCSDQTRKKLQHHRRPLQFHQHRVAAVEVAATLTAMG
jgi:hypothetical protein